MPQESVLGPKAYLAYAADVADSFMAHLLQYHLYADDMQGSAHSRPADVAAVVTRLQNCVADVGAWCSSKRLQLNAKKTEVLFFGSAVNLTELQPETLQFCVRGDIIKPVSVVRDLGVYFDSQLTMKYHIGKVAATCFYHLRRLRAVRKQLGRDVTQQLVSALILSRLDYCNVVLAGLPDKSLAPLQRVLNAAARLVLDLKPRDHLTTAFRELHWLPIRQRIEYKLCLMVHLAVGGRAPPYLSNNLTFVSQLPGRSSLRSAQSTDFYVPRTRLKIGERAYRVAAPRAWNRLPPTIRSVTSTKQFKSKLKTFLFSTAYNI